METYTTNEEKETQPKVAFRVAWVGDEEGKVWLDREVFATRQEAETFAGIEGTQIEHAYDTGHLILCEETQEEKN
jgi:hypothetical protein